MRHTCSPKIYTQDAIRSSFSMAYLQNRSFNQLSTREEPMKTRTRAALMVVASLCFCSSIILGQTKPDFSGAWKMNREKSKFEAIENIRNIVDKIEHKEPDFSEFITVTSVDGEQIIEGTYTTDGKERSVKFPSGSAKATAKWEGDALTVEWKSEGFNVRRKYTLSADGKMLTVAGRRSTPNGDRDGITVFEKQF